MDEYLDDSKMIHICRAMLAMITFYSLRTMNVIIEMELEAEGLIAPMPLEQMFVYGRP